MEAVEVMRNYLDYLCNGCRKVSYTETYSKENYTMFSFFYEIEGDRFKRIAKLDFKRIMENFPDYKTHVLSDGTTVFEIEKRDSRRNLVESWTFYIWM